MHPFENYKIQQLHKDQNNYYYRQQENILYKTSKHTFGKKSYTKEIYHDHVISYPLTGQELTNFKKLITTYKEHLAHQREDALRYTNSNLNLSNFDFDKEKIHTLKRAEYAITTYNADKPILLSHIEPDTLILVLYDPVPRRSFMAVIAPFTDLDYLKFNLEAFSNNTVEAQLFTTRTVDEHLFLDVFNLINSRQYAIKNISTYQNCSVAIDCFAGKTSCCINLNQPKYHKQHHYKYHTLQKFYEPIIPPSLAAESIFQTRIESSLPWYCCLMDLGRQFR